MPVRVEVAHRERMTESERESTHQRNGRSTPLSAMPRAAGAQEGGYPKGALRAVPYSVRDAERQEGLVERRVLARWSGEEYYNDTALRHHAEPRHQQTGPCAMAPSCSPS